ncbi:hypothetical protein KR009_004811 [Drosophila setifemur]|nr:hypothetical protein KR009_004811 [Drosophila setifemur]
MSDDDCDIFSAVRRRAPVKALPRETFNPCNDSFHQEEDYDFLEDTSKKPSKAGKIKPPKQPRGKTKRSKEEESKNYEPQLPKPSEGANGRALSPVSQLIQNMELEEAEEADKAPVATRTRKMERRSAPVEEIVVASKQPITKKRNTRNNKKRSSSFKGSNAVEDPVVSSKSLAGLNTSEISSRHAMAEAVARLPVADTIDLISAVPVRVEGLISLDSDEEAPAPAAVEETNIFGDENPIMEVAMSWLGEIQVYKLRKHQKFQHMFQEVAKRNQVDEDKVSIDKYYTFIGRNDTPHGIDLKSFHTLSGHATNTNNNITKNINPNKEYNLEALMRKPVKFQLKVQTNKMSRPLVLHMNRKDPFKILYIKCAEELDCDARQIKLFFDGEFLDPEDTPINQDMEGNELIDLIIKS